MPLNQFIVAGVNYKKTDVITRGHYAINEHQYEQLLSLAKQWGLKEVFVLSTCNRTEIYAVAPNADILINLLCSFTIGDKDTFKQLAYIKQGQQAIEHIFSVTAGLDSQILGDYEIVGQIKIAAKFAKEHGCIGTFMERLINSLLQSSKAIRSQTQLSGGTVSVSFAAIQFLKDKVKEINKKKIVLLGTGKIGRNTCKNLVDYLEAKNITLVNRTEEKAFELAGELQLQTASIDTLYDQVQQADIVIVATNANEPVIMKEDLLACGEKILIDLSIPNNIDPAAKELQHITLVNVDDLSKINDETLQMREAEVPKAKKIIAEHIEEFMEWLKHRKCVPALKAVKKKLAAMHHCNLYTSANPHIASVPFAEPLHEDIIQKVINNMAVKMRRQHQPGCCYIEAINDFITSSSK